MARWLCAWKESAKNFGIASAVPEGYWIHSPLILARRRLERSFFRQGICLQYSSFFRQGMCLRDIYFSSEYVLFRARSAPLEKEGVRCKKMNEWKGDEMIHCYQLTHQQQCMSKGRQRERYHRQPGWLATDSAPHLCGSEGNKSKNQVWRIASDPLPRWLTWEWQDKIAKISLISSRLVTLDLRRFFNASEFGRFVCCDEKSLRLWSSKVGCVASESVRTR